MAKVDPNEMSFLDHLEDLRWHILRSFIAIFIVGIGAFIFIFSILSASMSAHQVQLVTYHEKTNGVLIRIVVSNVPEVDNIAGWVGQENWFYLTLNEAVFAENVLENLKAKPPLLEIEGIQNQESVQIGFLI